MNIRDDGPVQTVRAHALAGGCRQDFLSLGSASCQELGKCQVAAVTNAPSPPEGRKVFSNWQRCTLHCLQLLETTLRLSGAVCVIASRLWQVVCTYIGVNEMTTLSTVAENGTVVNAYCSCDAASIRPAKRFFGLVLTMIALAAPFVCPLSGQTQHHHRLPKCMRTLRVLSS